jgi:hypothetical protein
MSGYDRTSYEAAELTYDGPFPEPLRRALRAGSASAAGRAEARAELGFLAVSIHGQIASIRARRAAGTCEAALRRDLALYRRAWRRWRTVLAGLR